MEFTPTGSFEIIKEADYKSKIVSITQTLEDYLCKGYFTSFDGAEIYYEYLKVKNPRGCIVIVHGYTEFLKKYYELCWYFANMGYSVFMYDARGHGYSHRAVSDNEVTHVDNYNDYAKDLDCYINSIVKENSDNAPIYIYAHSLGGAVSLLYLSKFNAPVKKAVLSAPMIYPECVPLPPFVLKKLLENEARKKGWDDRFKFASHFNPDAKAENSSDDSIERFYYNLNMRINEPRYQNSAGSNKWMYEAVRIKEELFDKRNIKSINTDILMIIAEKDTVVKTKPQKKLAKKLKCSIKSFEDAKHSLYTMTDKNLEKYILAVLDYLSI